MTDLHIDRLALRLAGRPESDGRRLAEAVADRLAAAELPAGAEPGDRRLTVTAPAGASVEQAADLIVAELLRQLG